MNAVTLQMIPPPLMATQTIYGNFVAINDPPGLSMAQNDYPAPISDLKILVLYGLFSNLFIKQEPCTLVGQIY